MKKIFYVLFSLIFLLKVEAQKKKNGVIENTDIFVETYIKPIKVTPANSIVKYK